MTKEYILKAGFIERFTRFIEWPANANMDDQAQPFVIGVIGDDPFDGNLDKFYKKTSIKNKKVDIHYYSSPDQIKPCNILFISESKHDEIESILKSLKSDSILTMADTDGYAEKGVMINFIIKEDKIRFEINESSIKQSKLKVSHLLLRQATVVNGS